MVQGRNLQITKHSAIAFSIVGYLITLIPLSLIIALFFTKSYTQLGIGALLVVIFICVFIIKNPKKIKLPGGIEIINHH